MHLREIFYKYLIIEKYTSNEVLKIFLKFDEVNHCSLYYKKHKLVGQGTDDTEKNSSWVGW